MFFFSILRANFQHIQQDKIFTLKKLNMKKLSTIIIAVFCSIFGYGQSFDLELSGGALISNYSISPQGEAQKYTSTTAKFQIAFSNIFENNFEVGMGIGYYSYYLTVGKEFKSNEELVGYITNCGSFQALSIPIFIGYKLNMGKQWYAKINTGVNFDFYFPSISTRESHSYSDFTHTTIASAEKFNILLCNKLSIYYITKFNMFVGAHISYNTGLRQIWDVHAQLDVNSGSAQGQGYDVAITSKGSYFQFGLTIGYRLEKKEKKG